MTASAQVPLGSVVIPAHDEASVIVRCLTALFTGFGPGELDVVVICNGCGDDTAKVARSAGYPIRVVEQELASKPAALRVGDRAMRAFPRLYLDADVALPGSAARAVFGRLRAGAVAARPRPLRERSILGAGSQLLPSPIAGSGSARIALGGGGLRPLRRRPGRFDVFSDVVADDLWVDRHFDRSEVEIVDCAPVVVTVPRRSRDLVRVLRRNYLGKAEPPPVARQTTGSGHRWVHRPGPWPARRVGAGRGSRCGHLRCFRGRRAIHAQP